VLLDVSSDAASPPSKRSQSGTRCDCGHNAPCGRSQHPVHFSGLIAPLDAVLRLWDYLTVSLQFVGGLLDTGWLILAFAAWRATWHFGHSCPRRRALLALLCAAVLLFPVISITDDLIEQSQVYDTAAAPLSFKSGKELKQIANLPGTPPIADGAGVPISELSFLQYIPIVPPTEPISLAGSTTGIHSPPAIV
jgi:hypothetical protein